jgi:hypothetical protein
VSADQNELRRLRREQRRRKARRRRLSALAVLACGVAAGVWALAFRGDAGTAGPSPVAAARAAPVAQKAKIVQRSVPPELRGVHVTMPLASLPGRLEEYMSLPGLNTIELDVKDESGQVGFVRGAPRLARAIGAARPYYNAKEAVRLAHKHGVYLIGRLVSFQDPILSVARPDLAVRTPDGSVWKTRAGLGWLDPGNRGAWDYDLAVAEAAARAGFDEIQLDYVRFPSDGDLSLMRFPAQVGEAKTWTIARYVHFMSTRLHRLHVRVSIDVFGLSASHELGVGQRPARLARYVDAVSPMVYPSHYTAGELGITDPNGSPGPTVSAALSDFRRALRGTHARLVPWLQDFSLGRTYSAGDVEAQMQAARYWHSAGFLLWNANGVYTPGILAPA